MKKFISTLLALSMVCAMSVSAFAEEGDLVNGVTPDEFTPTTASQSVQVTVNEGATGTITTVHKYYVTVAWTTAKPVVTKEGVQNTTYTWNGDTLAYETNQTKADATATPGSISVKVTNRSDLGILVSSSFEALNTSGATTDTADVTDQSVVAVAGSGSTDTNTAPAKIDGYDEVNDVKSTTITYNVKVPTSFTGANDTEVAKVTVTIKAA